MLAAAACAPASPDSAPSKATDSAVPVESCEAPVTTEGGGGAGGDLPDLALPCLGDGPVVHLATLTERPTLINLWASWCAPCRAEMPMLQQAFEDSDAVRFLGVDTRDTTAAAVSFLTDSGVDYPQVADVDGALLDDLGLPGLPVTLAVDPSGRMITTHIGQMTPEVLQDVLQQLSATAIPSPGN